MEARIKYAFLLFSLFFFVNSCSESIEEEQKSNVEIISDSAKNIYVYDPNSLLDSNQYNNLNLMLSDIITRDKLLLKCMILDTHSPYSDPLEYVQHLMYLNKDEDIEMVYIIIFYKDRKVVVRSNEVAEKKYSDSTCNYILQMMIPKLKEELYYDAFLVGIGEVEKIES